jgi:hypothetical protein
MVDVVVATGITMQYSWDQTRKMRSIESWRKGGVSAKSGIGHSFDLGLAVAGALRSAPPTQWEA